MIGEGSSGGSSASDDADRQAFIDQSGLAVYLRDVVRLLLAQRTEKPLLFIHEYFQSVLKGENVVLREYAYVNSTSRNRLSFIVNFDEVHVQSRCIITGWAR